MNIVKSFMITAKNMEDVSRKIAEFYNRNNFIGNHPDTMRFTAVGDVLVGTVSLTVNDISRLDDGRELPDMEERKNVFIGMASPVNEDELKQLDEKINGFLKLAADENKNCSQIIKLPVGQYIAYIVFTDVRPANPSYVYFDRRTSVNEYKNEDTEVWNKEGDGWKAEADDCDPEGIFE